MIKLEQIQDGEWFEPAMKNHKLGCCDCGLVHRVDFRVRDGKVQMRAVRARNYTAKQRKG